MPLYSLFDENVHKLTREKMRKTAEEAHVEVAVQATSEAELGKHLDQTDVILIDSQVKHLASKIQSQNAPYGVKLTSSISFLLLYDGWEKVLEEADRC